MTDTRTGPLDDLVVVDLTRALGGSHATMMLGDAGVELAPAGHRAPPPLDQYGDVVRAWPEDE